MTFYVYSPDAPLPTLEEVESGDSTLGPEGMTAYLAEQYPRSIYFEFTPAPTLREQVIAVTHEFLLTITDETQAVDIAFADLEDAVDAIYKQERENQS